MLSRVDHPSFVAEVAAATKDLALPRKRDVTYSCGSCGYELNLSSCNRNTRKIGSKYGKTVKKGIISFFAIDESKFSQKDELCCKPYFSKSSWGLFQRRTKLMCRKCSNHIGDAYYDSKTSNGLQKVDYISGKGALNRKYSIKISSIQPSDESGTPFLAM